MKKTTNNLATIYITSIDQEHLGSLIEISRERDGEMNRKYLDELESELPRLRRELYFPHLGSCKLLSL